jgi:hypothetical protein
VISLFVGTGNPPDPIDEGASPECVIDAQQNRKKEKENTAILFKKKHPLNRIKRIYILQ